METAEKGLYGPTVTVLLTRALDTDVAPPPPPPRHQQDRFNARGPSDSSADSVGEQLREGAGLHLTVLKLCNVNKHLCKRLVFLVWGPVLCLFLSDPLLALPLQCWVWQAAEPKSSSQAPWPTDFWLGSLNGKARQGTGRKEEKLGYLSPCLPLSLLPGGIPGSGPVSWMAPAQPCVGPAATMQPLPCSQQPQFLGSGNSAPSLCA